MNGKTYGIVLLRRQGKSESAVLLEAIDLCFKMKSTGLTLSDRANIEQIVKTKRPSS